VKLVFVSSPLRGDIEANVSLARKYCRYAIDRGCSCFAPHLFFTQMLDDYVTSERTAGIECGMEWLRHADEIWVFAKDETCCSAGMKKEVELARELNKPIVFVDPETVG